MRRGELVEQHISNLVWMAYLLDYSGLLLIHCNDKNYQIFFKKGVLVQQKNCDDPITMLEEIAEFGTGEFYFYDSDKPVDVENYIPVTAELREWLIDQSKKVNGYPVVFYSYDVMESRLSPEKLRKFPENLSSSTQRLYELCFDIPTISQLSSQYNISPKTILEVALEGIELGIISLLSSDGKLVLKSHLKNYIKPTSYQLVFQYKLKINESLTAKNGRIHVSTEKFDLMQEHFGDKPVKARIKQGYFEVTPYKIDKNEIMVTKSDVLRFSLLNNLENEIILVKGV
jgi:hypothetical protein